MATTDSPATTKLSDEHRKAFLRIFGKTPVVALPHGGMGVGARPQTIEDVIATVDTIVECLTDTMQRAEASRVELANVKYDLRAAGRLFDLMRQDGE